MLPTTIASSPGGPYRGLTLQDVWEVHMQTQWYIDQLTGLFDTGKNAPIQILKAKNDEYHQRFMKSCWISVLHRLTELVEYTYGGIFPLRAFLAQSNAQHLGSILKR